MESSKAYAVSVKFTGKNFALWEFQFRIFVQGRRLLSILDGSTKEPAEGATTKVKDDWEANNAQVMSWILSSIDPGIALSLRGFTSASAMWKHLTDLYTQTSASRKFNIKFEIVSLQQGDRDISSYYQAVVTLWTEHDLLTASLVSAAASSEVLKERVSSRLMQFLMRLRPEYEGIRASILHREVTTIEKVLPELLREETRLHSQNKLDIHTTDSAAVGAAFAVQPSRPQFHRTPTGEIICHFCKEPGHIQLHCKKRNTCNYCKKSGHLIGDCPILAKHGRKPSGSSSSPVAGGAYATMIAPAPVTPPTTPLFTQDDIRRFVQEALKDALPSALTSAFTTGMLPCSTSWHLDSAAYNHMTNSRSSFATLRPSPHLNLQVADGSQLAVSGIGSVVQPQLSLHDTLHVPKLVPSLVSVGQLAEDGCRIIFDTHGCIVQDMKMGMKIGHGSKHGRVFILDSYSRGESDASSGTEKDGSTLADQTSKTSLVVRDSVSNSLFKQTSYSIQMSDWDLWHCRLGHPNNMRLLAMFRNKWLSGTIGSDQHHDCVHCVQAKISQRSFTTSTTVYSEQFELVHTDLWGPSPVTSRMGFRYFALFIDHATRFYWVYFLRQKLDLQAIAQEFIQMVLTQFGKRIKIIRSDPGGEFTSHSLLALFKEHGILGQQSCPGVSKQNGLVERKHRHVLELTRAMLFHSQVPPSFWVEAVHTVVYRQITPVLQQQSPYQILFSRLPNYDWLRVFVCV
ncbi:Retrovirus-related Pol polyprotein from transposon RE1 [Linum grandiflorum]